MRSVARTRGFSQVDCDIKRISDVIFFFFLKKLITWYWCDGCQSVFPKIKPLLSSNLLLTHHDPSLDINVVSDVSKYRGGAVISRVFPDGGQKTITHVSRSLKAAFAIIFIIKKFYKMLFLKMVVIYHKEKGSDDSVNAVLSLEPEITSMFISTVTIISIMILETTIPDLVPQTVMRFHHTKWPKIYTDKRTEPFFLRQASLLEVNGCLLFTKYVIIQSRLHDRVIKHFH